MMSCCSNYCKNKDSNCVIYTSRPLHQIDVEGGEDLEKILKNIDRKFETLTFSVDSKFVGTSTGLGVSFYAGKNDNGIEEFRRLKVNEGLNVSVEDDSVVISINETWLERKIKEIVVK